MLGKALERTRGLWPEVERSYRWVHKAAKLLKNEAGSSAGQVRRRLAGLLGAIATHQPRQGKLAAAMTHFRKVSASYWPGLFHCYAVEGLPRTNNDLEHLFGSNRHHERRCTGRRNASPAMVLRGSVRLIAATASRIGNPTRPSDLAPADPDAWHHQRAELDPASGPQATLPLPTRPGGIPQGVGRPITPASFATLVFFQACGRQRCDAPKRFRARLLPPHPRTLAL